MSDRKSREDTRAEVRRMKRAMLTMAKAFRGVVESNQKLRLEVEKQMRATRVAIGFRNDRDDKAWTEHGMP